MKALCIRCAGELRKELITRRNYLFNTIGFLIITFILFFAIFWGVSSFAGPGFAGKDMDGLILGYVTWMFALGGFQSMAYAVQEEISQGTLEQLYIGSYSIYITLIIRAAVQALLSLVFTAVLLTGACMATGTVLEIDFLQFTTLLMLGMPSLWGIGLVLGVLVLLFKRIDMLFQVVTFLLIGIVALDAGPASWPGLLPFSTAASAIRAVGDGTVLAPVWYFWILGNSILYCILGVFVFHRIEKTARKRNLLSSY